MLLSGDVSEGLPSGVLCVRVKRRLTSGGTMILIWGFKARFKKLSGGEFHCPHEGVDRPYALVAVRKWFTFFWIPLIPLKELGEHVECGTCGSTYDPRVLTLPTTAQIEDQLTTALRHVVVAMLKADGVVLDAEREAAIEVMNRFAVQDYGVSELDRDLAELAVNDLEQELGAVAGMLSPLGQENVIQCCAMLAAADGDLDSAELDVLMHAGRSLGMTNAHVRGVLAELSPTP